MYEKKMFKLRFLPLRIEKCKNVFKFCVYGAIYNFMIGFVVYKFNIFNKLCLNVE